MSPNQVQQPTTASSSDPRGLPMANELPKTTSATFGITRRQEGHPPPYHASPSREDVPETMLVMSFLSKVAIDLFFFLLPFFFSLAWYLTDTKPTAFAVWQWWFHYWCSLFGHSSVGQKYLVTFPKTRSLNILPASNGRS